MEMDHHFSRQDKKEYIADMKEIFKLLDLIKSRVEDHYQSVKDQDKFSNLDSHYVQTIKNHLSGPVQKSFYEHPQRPEVKARNGWK